MSKSNQKLKHALQTFRRHGRSLPLKVLDFERRFIDDLTFAGKPTNDCSLPLALAYFLLEMCYRHQRQVHSQKEAGEEGREYKSLKACERILHLL